MGVRKGTASSARGLCLHCEALGHQVTKIQLDTVGIVVTHSLGRSVGTNVASEDRVLVPIEFQLMSFFPSCLPTEPVDVGSYWLLGRTLLRVLVFGTLF